MSLGALDFGLIVDGAVIITENSLRHLAERQRELGRILTREERLATVRASTVEMIRPSLYGQAIILLVYVPLLTFTGVEGKMFEPMALTVILALAAAFVLSLTFVPALIALAIGGRVQEVENRFVAGAQAAVPAVAASRDRLTGTRHCNRGRAVCRGPVRLHPPRPGVHPGARRKEHRDARAADPEHRAVAVAGDAARRRENRKPFPEVAFVFSKTGTAEIASDPMPPNASDTFIILKPRDQWPDPSLTKDGLIERDRQGRQPPARATSTNSPSRSRCASTSCWPACAATSP